MTRKLGEADALGFLGLARRAGSVVVGTEATRRSLRLDQVVLVLVARDASEGQVGKVAGILGHRKDLPVRWISSRDALGKALGAASVTMAGVTRTSFAEQLLRRLPSDSRKGPLRGNAQEVKEEPKRDAGR